MKLRLADKIKAIELRTEGKSYGEIMHIIPNLSKSTLSNWLGALKLTKQEEARLKNNLKNITNNARVRAGWKKREQKLEKISNIFKEANRDYKKLSKNKLFLVGLTLYWGEGGKKTEMFDFANSDPNAISVIIRWLNEIYNIPVEKIKVRLYAHKIYAHENYEEFWSKITNVPVEKFQKTIYKPTIHQQKRNPSYKGCLQIRVLQTDFYWKVMGLLDALARDMKK
jgi:hypothetical protein